MMTSQNRLTTVPTISPKFVNIPLQHKPKDLASQIFSGLVIEPLNRWGS